MKRLVAAALVCSACALETAAPDEALRPRGTYVVVPAKNPPRVGPGPRHRILYMNRHGGAFSPGNDDSSHNVSSIPSRKSTVSAWSYGDAKWNQFMVCIRDQYARHAVRRRQLVIAVAACACCFHLHKSHDSTSLS